MHGHFICKQIVKVEIRFCRFFLSVLYENQTDELISFGLDDN